MLAERHLEGTWWVPGTDLDAARGELTFTAGEFSLQVETAILDRSSSNPVSGVVRLEMVTEPIIHGETTNGTKVTVIGARAPIEVPEDDCFPALVWWPNSIVIGAHLDADATFDEIRFRSEHLDEWAGTPSLERHAEFGRGVTDSISYGATRQVLETADVEGLGSVEVIAIPVWSSSKRRAEIALQAAIRLMPDSPLPLKEIRDRADLVRRLIRTCVGAPSACIELFVQPTGSSSLLEVLSRTVAFGGRSVESVSSHEMLVTRVELGALASTLDAWRTTYARHEQAWHRLCSADHLQLTNTDELFIAYAKALEALHAGALERANGADEVRDERIERALASLPKDLIGWAEPLLRESKPPHARLVIQVLVESLGSIGEELSGGNPEGFALRVNATRNPLTHLRARRTGNYLHDREARYDYGQSMYLIGLTFLLVQVGVPLEQLTERLRQQSRAVSIAGSVTRFEKQRLS